MSDGATCAIKDDSRFVKTGEIIVAVWFVSRHPGAKNWVVEQGVCVDHWVDHLDPAEVAAEDLVIGTLPIHQVARICDIGARYLHLALDMPAELRGKELSETKLRALGARLCEFRVWALDGGEAVDSA